MVWRSIRVDLPTKIMGTLTAPACIAEPIKNITTATRIDLLRPMLSAMGPFANEPSQAAMFCQPDVTSS
jgi:hypothetical protein